MAWAPTGDDSWSGFSLSVPSIQYTLSQKELYEYKLPYNIPQAPCCARIHPKLYCCDVICCCFSAMPLTSMTWMDIVNQEDGHQLRFRQAKLCCRVPRIMAFADGQAIGHVSRTMRCLNRCCTCLEDVQKKPVLQVGFHDREGNVVARIDR